MRLGLTPDNLICGYDARYAPASAQSVPEQGNRASQKSCVYSEKLGLQRLARIMIFSDFSRVFSQESLCRLSTYIRCMKRGGLHHDGYASSLTDRASDDAKATAGDSGWRRSRFRVWIICETCKEMHTGTQESYIRKDESLCTSIG